MPMIVWQAERRKVEAEAERLRLEAERDTAADELAALLGEEDIQLEVLQVCVDRAEGARLVIGTRD